VTGQWRDLRRRTDRVRVSARFASARFFGRDALSRTPSRGKRFSGNAFTWLAAEVIRARASQPTRTSTAGWPPAGGDIDTAEMTP
jgi:hypothetical protein